jgi:starvation-inducible outer membrane lipoprotein
MSRYCWAALVAFTLTACAQTPHSIAPSSVSVLSSKVEAASNSRVSKCGWAKQSQLHQLSGPMPKPAT